MGKRLYDGSFSSGSLRVTGGANYSFVIMYIAYIPCFGNWGYGQGGIAEYNSHQVNSNIGYRFDITRDGNDVTISTSEASLGGSVNGAASPIQSIYGIF